jgi:hypothetical protein
MVMAELVILNVPQDVLSRMRRLANKGDEEAQRWLKVDLWKDYTPPFACLLCDGEVHQVNATLSLPDKKPRKGEKQQMMIAPLCDTCDGLPALVRWNRIIKLMKAMRPGWHPAGGAWGR